LDPSGAKKDWLLPAYDSDLEPMLRMMHTQDILSCGWLSMDNARYVVRNGESKARYEFEVDYQNIRPATNITTQPKLNIASFDLECTSSGDGTFPQFDKPDHHIIQIGTTITTYGIDDSMLRYVATLGDCSPIEGAIVESYDTEDEMILGWVRFIERSNVHILTGYNIYGFDMRYLYKRAEMFDIEDELLEGLSWLRNGPAVYVEKQLISSGLGDNMLYRIDIPGIVSLDVMKVLQADASKKLTSWKLDHVAEHFTGQKKEDVKPNEIFALQEGDADDRKRIATYCIQDCALCNLLIDRLCLLTNNIAMAAVCCVPLSYIFLRGQGIKIFSLVAKYCANEGFAIPTKDRTLPRPEGKYQGAIVLNMVPGYYDTPITVLDFASLYPSSQIAANLSHDTLVVDERYNNLPNVSYRDVEFEEDGRMVTYRWASVPGKPGVVPNILKHLLNERKAVKKMMKSETNAFMKQVLDGQQQALKITCNSVYGQTGAFTSNIYLRPLASCTTALGREFLMFSKNFVETNYEGHECIYGDTDSIFIKGPPSTKSRTNQLSEAIDQGIVMAERITEALNLPALVLEYEKVYYPFGMLNRKRYIGRKYEAKDDVGKLITMGDAMKRRDSAPIVKEVYGDMIARLFPTIQDILKNNLEMKNDIHSVIMEARRTLEDILGGRKQLEAFIITVTLRSQYKNPQSIPHKVLADRITLRDPGNAPQSNDRMAYCFVERLDLKTPRPGEALESPEFVKEHNLVLDYLHYVEHQIKKPLEQLLSLFMPENPLGGIEDIIIKAKKERILKKRQYKNKVDGFVDIEQYFA